MLLLKSALKSHILEGFCTIERLKKWSILGRLDGRCAVDSQIPKVELLFFSLSRAKCATGPEHRARAPLVGGPPIPKVEKPRWCKL